MRNVVALLLATSALLGFAACARPVVLLDGSKDGAKPEDKAAGADTALATSGVDERFADALSEVARTYEAWSRVDDEARWAPYLCRMPFPSVPRMSGSDDASTHGKKLFYVFAKDRNDYMGMTAGGRRSPMGQVIVKESWIPEEVTGTPPKEQAHSHELPNGERDLEPSRIARHDGHIFKTGERAGLYIMMRLDPATPGTDDGWVYGTFQADRNTLTGAGRMASCMACHETEKGRVFGLPARESK